MYIFTQLHSIGLALLSPLLTKLHKFFFHLSPERKEPNKFINGVVKKNDQLVRNPLMKD